MAAQLLAPVDLTGEPTVWAFQELQFWDALRRVWVRQNIRPAIGPSTVWRSKVGELELWDPFTAWPVHMGEHRGGYRARLLVWDGGGWVAKRTVQAYA